VVIARSPFSEQTCLETNYSTGEKRAMLFLQILNNYFGVGGEEKKKNILIHAL